MSRTARSSLALSLLVASVSLIATPVGAGDFTRFDRATEETTTSVVSPPEDLPTPVAVVAQYLDLDPYQVEILARLLAERQFAAAPLVAGIGQREHAVSDQLNSDEPNPVAIGVLMLQINQLQKQVATIQQTFHATFVSTLGDAQKSRLAQVSLAATLQPIVPVFKELGLV